MLLLVDAGNTRVKWALIDRSQPQQPLGQWHASGSVARADADELVEVWRRYKIGRVLLSNVAGPNMRDALENAVLRALGTRPVALEWFTSCEELGGVRNGYLNPPQLGCDRFASAIGAYALFPDRPLIVATCGTATTVDAVSANGVFIGGMILPGLGTMASSLAKNTAQLPDVALHTDLDHPFANHTNAAIVSGCLAAQAGAIERAVAAHARANPEQPVSCILAGGAADLIAPHLNVAHERVDNLVLIGLQSVATHVSSTC
ncbi:MAG TPA: type III pantothenate kinase [Oxalicibacterium sp.]|jgi:type III pantothenate kinase|nr:type III pantothenate kinase [Oxalicibacterium sp.]